MVLVHLVTRRVTAVFETWPSQALGRVRPPEEPQLYFF